MLLMMLNLIFYAFLLNIFRLVVYLTIFYIICKCLWNIAYKLYLGPHTPSKEVLKNTKIVIVGAGFSGISAAYKLDKVGLSNYIILEKRSDIGGTWFDNTYPGAACDVPSAVYSLSFFLYAKWTESHASSQEIFMYLKCLVQKFGIIKKIKFNQNVTSCVWNDKSKQWSIKTENEEEYLANFVLQCSGPLMVPNYPSFPLDCYEAGPAIHSSRWKPDIDLTDKKVAIIGTGASAVQLVPSLAPIVKHLTVFQRSPPWVSRRAYFHIPIWVREVYSKLPFLMKIHRLAVFALSEFFYFMIFSGIWARGYTIIKNRVLRNITDILKSRPDLLKLMVPSYKLGCKRVTPSNSYLQAYLRNNVSLVTSRITTTTSNGLKTEDGITRDFEALIYATGFNPYESMVKAFKIIGKNEITFEEHLGKEPKAYFGISYPGFPNYFTILGPNTGLGHNSVVFMAECSAEYIIDKITYALKNNCSTVEVKTSAVSRYNREIHNRLEKKVWASGCGTWYTSKSGFNYTIWPDSSTAFWIRSLQKNYNDFIFE